MRHKVHLFTQTHKGKGSLMHTETQRERFTYAYRDTKGKVQYGTQRHEGKGSLIHTETQRERFT